MRNATNQLLASAGGTVLTGLGTTSGTEVGGNTVQLNGRGFTGTVGAGGVKVNGVNASSYNVINNNRIDAVFPAFTSALSSTAASNVVSVSVTNAGVTSTLAASYTYTSELKRIAGASYVSEYRANDPALGLSNGNPVATWPDYNGLNPLAQGNASKRPTFESAGFNGGPSILGDGVDDALVNTSATGIGTGKRPYCLVVTQRVSGANATVSSMQGTTGSSVDTFEYSGGGWQTTRDDDSGASATNGFGALNTNRNLMEHGFTASGLNGLVAFSNGLNTTRTGSTDEAITKHSVLGDPNGAANTNTRIVARLVLSDEPDAGTLTALRAAYHAAMWIGYTSSSLSIT